MWLQRQQWGDVISVDDARDRGIEVPVRQQDNKDKNVARRETLSYQSSPVQQIVKQAPRGATSEAKEFEAKGRGKKIYIEGKYDQRLIDIWESGNEGRES